MKIDIRGIGRFFGRNTHIITAAVAIVGTGFTAYEAFKAGHKIGRKLDKAEEAKGRPLDLKEKTEIISKDILPTALAAGGTVTAIVAGTVSAESCIKGLAKVATNGMKKYNEYRSTVASVDAQVADEVDKVVAQAQISENPVPARMPSEDEVLYYDSLTETEFWGEPGVVLRATNRLKARLLTMGYFTVADYRDALGIPRDKKPNYFKIDEYKITAWDQFSFVRKGRYPSQELAEEMQGEGLDIFEEVIFDDNDTLERHYIWVSHDPDVNLLDNDYSRIRSHSGPRE